MPSEKLEKLKHERYVAERKLTAARHREKQLESEMKRLTRSERTHRLCTRAGMLETFLKEPTLPLPCWWERCGKVHFLPTAGSQGRMVFR